MQWRPATSPGRKTLGLHPRTLNLPFRRGTNTVLPGAGTHASLLCLSRASLSCDRMRAVCRAA